jgi:hypothetical protein
MTDLQFLQRLAEGYVRSYRTFNLRADSKWEDNTRRELDFFARLGERLGYIARYEDKRTDLTWHDIDTQTIVLALERETDAGSVLADTFPRLFQVTGARYLAAVLGWVRESDLARISPLIQGNLGSRSMLTLAWVGTSRDSADTLYASVHTDARIVSRQGKGHVDLDRYWYARFSGEWQ